MTNLHTVVTTILITAAILSGCSGVPVAEVRNALANTQACCASYETVPTANLPIGKSTKFELTIHSPAFQSPFGLAYFAAFKLEAGSTSLTVQSMNTEYLPKATYPDPVLVFLDQIKKPISVFSGLGLQRNRQLYFPGFLEYYYGATVAVPQGADYVVIYAHPNSDRIQSAISENGKYWPVPPAPVGTIAVIPSATR